METKEQKKIRNKEYNSRNYVKARAHERYIKQREEKLIYSKKYKKENKEKIAIYQKWYRENHNKKKKTKQEENLEPKWIMSKEQAAKEIWGEKWKEMI